MGSSMALDPAARLTVNSHRYRSVLASVYSRRGLQVQSLAAVAMTISGGWIGSRWW
jgi:hypothetical protein